MNTLKGFHFHTSSTEKSTLGLKDMETHQVRKMTTTTTVGRHSNEIRNRWEE